MNSKATNIYINAKGVDNFFNQLNEIFYFIENGRWGKYGEECDEDYV